MRLLALLVLGHVMVACTTVQVQSEASKKKAAAYNAQLGSQYLQAGDLKKAREKLQKAISQDEDNPSANFTYGMLLARVKQVDDAKNHFAREIQLVRFQVPRHHPSQPQRGQYQRLPRNGVAHFSTEQHGFPPFVRRLAR